MAEQKRSDDRENGQIRAMGIELDPLNNADGSATFKFGRLLAQPPPYLRPPERTRPIVRVTDPQGMQRGKALEHLGLTAVRRASRTETMAGVYGPREAKIHQRSSEESIVTVSIAASRADRDAGRCVPAASPCPHVPFPAVVACSQYTLQ